MISQNVILRAKRTMLALAKVIVPEESSMDSSRREVG